LLQYGYCIFWTPVHIGHTRYLVHTWYYPTVYMLYIELVIEVPKLYDHNSHTVGPYQEPGRAYVLLNKVALYVPCMICTWYLGTYHFT